MKRLLAGLTIAGAVVVGSGALEGCSCTGDTMLAAAHCGGVVHQLPNSPGTGFGEEPGDGTVGPI